jgi:hypothetical protein
MTECLGLEGGGKGAGSGYLPLYVRAEQSLRVGNLFGSTFMLGAETQHCKPMVMFVTCSSKQNPQMPALSL